MSTELTRSPEPPPPPEDSGVDPNVIFTPPIDIFETDAGLVLLADLPGVTSETLELQVQDNKLTLFGRVKSPVPPGTGSFTRNTVSATSCGRSF